MGFEQLNYLIGGKLANGITPASLAYNNVTWEKVTTANFGIDLGLLNNRLTASFDYFLRYTNDMVVSKPTLLQWDQQGVKKTWPTCEQMVGS